MLGFGWLPKPALHNCSSAVLVVNVLSVLGSVTIHQRTGSHLRPKTLGGKSKFSGCYIYMQCLLDIFTVFFWEQGTVYLDFYCNIVSERQWIAVVGNDQPTHILNNYYAH